MRTRTPIHHHPPPPNAPAPYITPTHPRPIRVGGTRRRCPRPAPQQAISAPRPCPVAPRAASVLAGSHCPSHDAVNAVTRPALTSHGAVTNRDQGLAARVTAPDLVFYRSRSRAATLAAPNTCALNRAGGPPGADAPHGTNTRTDTRTRRRRPERRRRCRRRPSGALHGAGRGASAARPAPSPAILHAAAGPHTLCGGRRPARTHAHTCTHKQAGRFTGPGSEGILPGRLQNADSGAGPGRARVRPSVMSVAGPELTVTSHSPSQPTGGSS